MNIAQYVFLLKALITLFFKYMYILVIDLDVSHKLSFEDSLKFEIDNFKRKYVLYEKVQNVHVDYLGPHLQIWINCDPCMNKLPHA